MEYTYFCHFCSYRVDKDGYIDLNVNGSFTCPSCKKTYNYRNLIKKLVSTLILTFLSPTQ